MKIFLAKNDMNEIVEKLKKFSRKLTHQILILLKKHYNKITIENDLFFDREENIKKMNLKMNLRKNIIKFNKIIQNFNN